MVEIPKNGPARATAVFAASNAYIEAILSNKPRKIAAALAEWERVADDAQNDSSEVKNG